MKEHFWGFISQRDMRRYGRQPSSYYGRKGKTTEPKGPIDNADRRRLASAWREFYLARDEYRAGIIDYQQLADVLKRVKAISRKLGLRMPAPDERLLSPS